MKLISFTAGLAVLATQAYAVLFESITQLNSDNWSTTIENDKENVWFVTFYADWCPYCKAFESELSAAVADKTIQGMKVKFGALDVMASRDLTAKYGIKRSPTVKLFGKDKAAPEDYLGQRKVADVVTYIGDYCKANNFMAPPPPNYLYNVNAVLGAIKAAGDKRNADAEKDTLAKLNKVQVDYGTEQAQIKKTYDEKLAALIKERADTYSTSLATSKTNFDTLKAKHVADLAAWTQEVKDVQTAVQTASTNNIDLTYTIEQMKKDWLKITWDATNRREKTASAPTVAPKVTTGPAVAPRAVAPAPAPAYNPYATAPRVTPTQGYPTGYGAPVYQASAYQQPPRYY